MNSFLLKRDFSCLVGRNCAALFRHRLKLRYNPHTNVDIYYTQLATTKLVNNTTLTPVYQILNK